MVFLDFYIFKIVKLPNTDIACQGIQLSIKKDFYKKSVGALFGLFKSSDLPRYFIFFENRNLNNVTGQR
jgi:hypothetical protein